MEREGRPLAEDLRSLPPMQEKVVRLHYGLGCERAHGAGEIARALAVSATAIRQILQEAQRQLSLEGWTPSALRSAAGRSAEQAREPARLGEEARSCRGRSR